MSGHYDKPVPDLPQALCATYGNPDWFFAADAANPPKDVVSRAKALCAACPEQVRCLEYAMRYKEQHGIWGGLTTAERKAKERNGTRVRRKVLGTTAT